MLHSLKIGKINLSFVFRHRWDRKDVLRYNSEFPDYRIGMWFRISRIVGQKNFNRPNEWGNNLVNNYTIGINLIICKMWISFDIGGMSM